MIDDATASPKSRTVFAILRKLLPGSRVGAVFVVCYFKFISIVIGYILRIRLILISLIIKLCSEKLQAFLIVFSGRANCVSFLINPLLRYGEVRVKCVSDEYMNALG